MKSLSERNPIAVGLAGLAILVVIALLAFNADNLPIIGGGTTYTALFTEDAGLNPGNEVRNPAKIAKIVVVTRQI